MNRTISRKRSNKIKAMLVERGITQQSIADDLGISLCAVSGAINGHFSSRRTIEYVAQLLKTDANKLLSKAA